MSKIIFVVRDLYLISFSIPLMYFFLLLLTILDSLKSTVLPLLKQMIVLAFKMDDSLLVTISNFFGKMCLGVESKYFFFKLFCSNTFPNLFNIYL